MTNRRKLEMHAVEGLKKQQRQAIDDSDAVLCKEIGSSDPPPPYRHYTSEMARAGILSNDHHDPSVNGTYRPYVYFTRWMTPATPGQGLRFIWTAIGKKGFYDFKKVEAFIDYGFPYKLEPRWEEGEFLEYVDTKHPQGLKVSEFAVLSGTFSEDHDR